MESKPMTPNDVIRYLIHHINYENKAEFYKLAEKYLSELTVGGKNYHNIRTVLNQKPMKMMTLESLSKDVKALISSDQQKDEFVFLNSDIGQLIEEILFEWENKEIYQYHNLNIRNKILLHGPTGNGKTTVARNIAKLSNLPFVEVRSDMMIDSHLGNTGQNIHKLFNSIKEPCILFWDEVDSIGKRRGTRSDNSAAYENERMVNSILVNIDKLANDVIFIGATNRRDILDEAFVRRFNILHEVTNPSLEEKESFAAGLLEYHKMPVAKIHVDHLLNFSEIKEHVIGIARTFVIEHLLTKKASI
jgi:SpoVK/Ycf46/Vps4 family AAA+-type ATPase